MNPPQLPIAPSGKVASGVHHQNVVRHKEVALLPRVPICYPAIVKQTIKDGTDFFLGALWDGTVLVLDRDEGRVKLCLGLGPWFVIPKTSGLTDKTLVPSLVFSGTVEWGFDGTGQFSFRVSLAFQKVWKWIFELTVYREQGDR